jgi:hypothetical protein
MLTLALNLLNVDSSPQQLSCVSPSSLCPCVGAIALPPHVLPKGGTLLLGLEEEDDGENRNVISLIIIKPTRVRTLTSKLISTTRPLVVGATKYLLVVCFNTRYDKGVKKKSME